MQRRQRDAKGPAPCTVMRVGAGDDHLFPQLVGGTIGLLPGGSLLAVAGERAARAVSAELRRNQSRTLHLAIQRAGMSREDLAEALETQPSLVPLLIRVLHAAGMNGHDKTLRLLAGFLGDALGDVSRVDDASLMLTVVSDLGEHHVKVLETVSYAPSELPKTRNRSSTHWTTGLLKEASNMREELVLVAVQGLINAGLVADAGIDGGGPDFEGGTILEITEMGKTVLEVLKELEP